MSNTNCDTRPPCPPGSLCNTQNCLIQFDGYWWWTNYPFNISREGYWFKNQQWDPRLVTVEPDGLHLKMQKTMIPGAPGIQWSSSEVILWGKANQPSGPNPPERFYPGFGTYLVAASVPGGFDTLANNCCFGAFTYRFDQDNTQTNIYHELDIVELSRFGKLHEPSNAQFALQPWDWLPANVHRITLTGKGDITFVMHWPGAGVPVTFSAYYGIFSLDNLPAIPDITWTTSAEQNKFIPTDGCQTVHFNLWREPASVVVPNSNQEVVVKKFQFRPA